MSTLQDIENCGIVGAGGAGFPSHVKYNAKAEFVIMNGAECEPLMHKDKEILKAYTRECIEGMRQVMRLVGAKKGIFGIKEKYKDVVDAVRALLDENMEILPMGNYYPAGDELILVYEATGRVVAPGNIPLSVGCVVTNVETLLNVARNEPVITSFLTVAGAVAHPVSLEVAVGTPIREAILAAGGATVEDPVMLIGGVMMGQYSTDFDQPVLKTTGGIVVLPREHDLIRRHTRPAHEYDKIAKASCDQCNFCTEMCPRFLLGHPIEPHKNMRNKGFKSTVFDLVAGAEFCCECNLCSFYACPEDLDPKNVSTDMKRIMQKKTEGRLKFAPGSVEAHPMAEFRKAPVPKLMKKLKIDHFENHGPLLPRVIAASTVVIPLKQHIGQMAEALVKAGDQVKKGQRIGQIPQGKMGANIHASISGRVIQVSDRIVIQGE